MSERRVLARVLGQDVQRLVADALAKPDHLRRVNEELTRLVTVALMTPPNSVEALELSIAAYEAGGEAGLLQVSLVAFLQSVPPDVEQLLTESRNGTESLMSQLRHEVERERQRRLGG